MLSGINGELSSARGNGSELNIMMDSLAPVRQRLWFVQSMQGHVKFEGEASLQKLPSLFLPYLGLNHHNMAVAL